MSIQKLDHVSILSASAEKTAAFYQEFLGFEPAEKRELPKLGMRICDLKARGDFIEIIEPLAKEGKEGGREGGLKHVAFRSDDIEADFAAFKQKGADMVHPEVQRQGRAAFFFVRSPSGELVEVIEYLPSDAPLDGMF
ncbi:MAG: VOC family protein [Elusimicrobia bacterium]|nr:VOC family protein [Elusimicrobiota bacterium]